MTRKKRLARRAERKRKLRVVEKVTAELRGERISQSQFRQFRTPPPDDLIDAVKMFPVQQTKLVPHQRWMPVGRR